MTAPQLTQYVQGQGSVNADGLNTFMQTTNVTADLRNFVGVTGIEVATRGQATVNDGGSGLFYWNAFGTGPDDGVNTIVPFGASTGVWSRVIGAGAVASITTLLGGSGNFSTPISARQLRVRMWGGGGGGCGSGGAGAGSGNTGGASSFNGIFANGGEGGQTGGRAGLGGAGGAGIAAVRIPGFAGQLPTILIVGVTYNYIGGYGGGPGCAVTGGVNGGSAAANSSGGGQGGGFTGTNLITSLNNLFLGFGGGSGERAELVINGPTGTYPYTVGVGGGIAAAGLGGGSGGAGGSGLIIVETYF